LSEGILIFTAAIRDLNSLLGAHERLGGKTPLKIACFEFSNWTNLNALIHLETNGVRFTWTNRREGGAFMAQRIDRAICNESWIDYWSVFSCNTLVKCFSDHFPLLLTLNKNPPITIIPRFKFFKAWTDFESCESLVSSHWLIPTEGTPMHALHFKLKSLKPKLKSWNKSMVGDFHQRVHWAQQQLSEAHMAIDQLSFSDKRSLEELTCLTSYSHALHLLNSFWKDKNKNARFLKGDMNTAFFHRNAKVREAKTFISLQHRDETYTSTTAIETHVLSYFTNIFSALSNMRKMSSPTSSFHIWLLMQRMTGLLIYLNLKKLGMLFLI